MIIFNWLGLGMFVLAMVIASVIANLIHYRNEEVALMLGGPIALMFDVAYRSGHRMGHWFHPDRGGSLFFLPVWLWGIFFLIRGAVILLEGQSPDVVYAFFGLTLIVAVIALTIALALPERNRSKDVDDSSSKPTPIQDWGQAKAEPSAIATKVDEKDLCYLCGKPLAGSERSARVCQKCRD